MTLISTEEADNFAIYSSRLTEIDNQLDLLSKQYALSENEKELTKNLIIERNLIVKWFNGSMKPQIESFKTIEKMKYNL